VKPTTHFSISMMLILFFRDITITIREPILRFNEGNDSDPIISDNSTRRYIGTPEGPICITVGTAGQDLHELKGHSLYVVEQFQRHGFLEASISDNGTNLTSTFYENRKK
jgi:hypothetical protein